MENCERLYRENRERVLRFLLHLTGDVELARDLVQETFARYLSRYGRDSEQPGLLFTIARNAGLDALRRRRTSTLPERETADPRRDPEHQLIDRQEMDRLLAAISAAFDEPKTRLVLALPFSAGRKHAWLHGEGVVIAEAQDETGWQIEVEWTARQEKLWRDL